MIQPLPAGDRGMRYRKWPNGVQDAVAGAGVRQGSYGLASVVPGTLKCYPRSRRTGKSSPRGRRRSPN